ncbi:MAG: glycosyltransferase [Bacteroidales bacterium]|nr:glycosyltransferase [Bacteroidales bacterium]
MNKPDVLRTCLDSILLHTHSISYETFVVAYLYTPENLQAIQGEYPWVKWIESNSIRGFSENNNLALQQASGDYCFIVNDDTLWDCPLIDLLVQSMRELELQALSHSDKRPAVVSPIIHKPDGRDIQYCGRNPINALQSIALFLNIWHDNAPGPFTHKQGLFRTYNICGASFLIHRGIFEQMGWFDERFFFCPEDIALSSLLNKSGYSCWVDTRAHITHLEGMSGRTSNVSLIQTATIPAYVLGTCLYYANGSLLRLLLMRVGFLLALIPNMCRHYLRGLFKAPGPNADTVLARGECNAIASVFRSETPKQAFIRYYNQITR